MRCKEEKENNVKIHCNLCGEHDGIMKKNEDKYIHHYCYVFFKNSLLHVKCGKCKNCKIKNIPVLKCEYHGCKDKYHIKCALEKGIIFSLTFLRDDKKKEVFNEKIPFYCEIHNKEVIDNYAQLMSVMADSMKDKNKKTSDNNPINEVQNNDNDNNKDTNSNIINNEEIESSNKEKEHNLNSNDNNNNEEKITDNINEENKEKEKANKSISSNSHIERENEENQENAENYSQASDKTPVNNYSLDKENNSINDKNSIASNENENSKYTNNDNNNNDNNNDNMNDSVSKTNNEQNNNINENKNRNNNEKNNNNKDDDDELFDINMDVDEEDKNKSGGKEKKNEDNNMNISRIEEEEDIISSSKDKQNTISNDFKEKTEYQIPEIKYETVDLFENFRKMNENYCFPGSFFKFHGV
jgi:hypothetical protein